MGARRSLRDDRMRMPGAREALRVIHARKEHPAMQTCWMARLACLAAALTAAPHVAAQQVGKPAPEISVSAARGIESDLKLSDLKGKWVVLEFWGHW